MKAARNGLADYARFASVLGIIWFNMGLPGGWITVVAMPVFLVLLIADTQPGLAANASRFLKPFLLWSCVFAVIQTTFAQKYGTPTFEWWDPHMAVSGTSLHLWVLPFAFVAAVLAPWFRHPLASLGAALLVASLLASGKVPGILPLPEWSHAAIPVLAAIGFMAWGWRLAATTLFASWLVLLLGRPSPESFSILAGTALALIVLSYRLPATPLSDWCGRISIGIYLAHPLIILIGNTLRITWVELGLFTIVGSVVVAQILDMTLNSGRTARVK